MRSKTHTKYSIKYIALAGLLLTALSCIALIPPPAHAGQASVYASQAPNGTPIPADGWVFSESTPGHIWRSDPGKAGDGVNFAKDGGIGAGQWARWIFDTLPGTNIRAIQGTNRSLSYGTPQKINGLRWEPCYQIWRNHFDVLFRCTQSGGCSKTANHHSWGENISGSRVGLQLECLNPGPQGQCNGNVHAMHPQVWVTIDKDGAPTASNITGGLTHQAPLSGTQSLSYNAHDPAMGIYRQFVYVDGSPVASQSGVIDNNGGRCGSLTGNQNDHAFAYREPCAKSLSPTVTLDTTQYGDGEHHLLVQVQDATGNTATVFENDIKILNTAPRNTTPPTLTGTAMELETITLKKGKWSNANSYRVVWKRINPDGTNPIQFNPTETKAHTLTAGDIGHRIQVEITATGPTGKQTTVTTTSAVIQEIPAPTNTRAPSLAGMTTEGQRLTLDPGGWDNNPVLTYQWKRCDARGANCVSFVSSDGPDGHILSVGDVGSRMAVEVTATGRGGKRTVLTTPLTGVVAAKSRSSLGLTPLDSGLDFGSGEKRVGNQNSLGSGSSLRSDSSPLNPGKETLLLAPAGTHFENHKSVHRGKMRARFDRSTTITGKLLDGKNHPLRGVQLQVVSRAKDGKMLKPAVVHTGRNGWYRYRSKGPSRTVSLKYLNVSNQVTVAVTGKVSLRVPRTAYIGRSLVFQGRVHGRHIPRGGVAVTVQARVPGKRSKWDLVRTTRTRSNGQYRISWPKLKTANSAYQFRAIVIRDSKWGYESATSRTIRTTVKTR